jgi:hypothetical protein
MTAKLVSEKKIVLQKNAKKAAFKSWWFFLHEDRFSAGGYGDIKDVNPPEIVTTQFY